MHTYKNGKHGWMLDKAPLGAKNLEFKKEVRLGL